MERESINHDDEIDLIDLIKKVWDWKFFILLVVIAGELIFISMYYFAPVLYKSTVPIKIGKIANISLEQYEDLDRHLQISNGGNDNYYLPYGEKAGEYFKGRNIADIVYVTAEKSKDRVTLTATGLDYDETVSSLNSFRTKVIKRHDEIFKKSIKKFENLELDSGNKYNINYTYLITSYNYPTQALGEISTVQTKLGVKFDVNDNDKIAPVFHSGLIKYLILVFISFTFFGVFSAFVLDYAFSEVKKRKVS